VASDDDNDSSHRTGARAPQPFVGSREQAEFLDVLRLLEEGKLEPEQGLKRLMSFYQMGMGAWMRALGEIRPEIASEMVKKLTRDMSIISQTYDAPFNPQVTDVVTPGAPRNYRLTNKTTETLHRERVILRALIGTNRNMASSELRERIEKIEPNVKTATITANLDRLWKIQQIDRPRKGHYARTENSPAYLAALENEIEARGQNLHRLDNKPDGQTT